MNSVNIPLPCLHCDFFLFPHIPQLGVPREPCAHALQEQASITLESSDHYCSPCILVFLFGLWSKKTKGVQMAILDSRLNSYLKPDNRNWSWGGGNECLIKAFSDWRKPIFRLFSWDSCFAGSLVQSLTLGNGRGTILNFSKLVGGIGDQRHLNEKFKIPRTFWNIENWKMIEDDKCGN